jgi:hypothetical protein
VAIHPGERAPQHQYAIATDRHEQEEGEEVEDAAGEAAADERMERPQDERDEAEGEEGEEGALRRVEDEAAPRQRKRSSYGPSRSAGGGGRARRMVVLVRSRRQWPSIARQDNARYIPARKSAPASGTSAMAALSGAQAVGVNSASAAARPHS